MPNIKTNEELLARVSDLEQENEILKSRKKYGLVWEPKDEDVVLECENNIPILKEIENRKIVLDNNAPTNILIEGDNYNCLSILNYTNKGTVDVIYADPPYNTGNQSWRYNNNYVEKEDSFIHSKWLSFIYNRVKLSKDLLKEDGIFVFTIDDYEIFTAGLLLDSIFGENNRIGVVAIETNPRGRTTNKFFATSHEYILFYAKNGEDASLDFKDLTEEQMGAFNLKDDVSQYRLLPFRRSGGLSTREERPNSFYPIYFNKKTGEISIEKIKDSLEIFPIDGEGRERVWRQTRPSLMLAVGRGDIVIRENKSKYTILMKDRIKDGRKSKTLWINPHYDASSHGTVLIQTILNKRKVFDYPKSIYAVVDTLKVLIKSNKNALVLDFFAGSGTTGHAVMELNKEDGGNRKFILCTNNEKKICEEVTYERLKRVIQGYKNKKGEKVEGLGGNLRYLKTELVSKTNHRDTMKIRLTKACTEMLCLKEGIFEIVLEKNNKKTKELIYKIIEGHTQTGPKVMGVYFDIDDNNLDNMLTDLKKFKGDKVAYIFSLSGYGYELDDKKKWQGVSVEPIPQKILEIYEEIFKTSKKKK